MTQILGYRLYQNQTDAAALWQVLEDSREADQVDAFSTLEGFANLAAFIDYLDDDHCVPTEDVQIAEANGQVVGFARVCRWTETDGTWLFLHNEFAKPEFRASGVMETLMTWAENRARMIAQGLPTKGKAMLGTNATSSEPLKTELILKAGYNQTFTMVELENRLVGPVATVPLPNGFELRPIESKHVRAIWEANNAVYEGRPFINQPTEEDYQEFVTEPLNDYSLWVVAWVGEAITGFVLSQIKNDMGEVTQVGVLPKYRRHGLAHALMLENLKRLQHRGIARVRLHTNGENISGARSLYEKVGFNMLKTYGRYRKPIS